MRPVLSRATPARVASRARAGGGGEKGTGAESSRLFTLVSSSPATGRRITTRRDRPGSGARAAVHSPTRAGPGPATMSTPTTVGGVGAHPHPLRLRLNVDFDVLPRRANPRARAQWFVVDDRASAGGTVGSVARAIRAALHLTRDAETSFCAWTATPSLARRRLRPSRRRRRARQRERQSRPRRAVAPLASRRRRRPGRHAGPERRDGKHLRAPHDAPPAPLSPADPDPTRDPSDDPDDAAFAATAPGTDPDRPEVEARGEKRSNARARGAPSTAPR